MSIKLIVLGLLMEGDRHPYEIQQVIKDRQMDQYIKFQKGSLYYAVNQLEKEGFIEVTNMIKDGKRPEKTIYRITDSGKEKFQELLMKQFSVMEHFHNPIYGALHFAKFVDQSEVSRCLDEKIRKVEDTISEISHLYEVYKTTLPRASLHIMRSSIEFRTTELKWLKAIKQDAHEGRLTEIGGLDE